MVRPQAYRLIYDIVSDASLDDSSNFDCVIEVIGDIASGNVVLTVPDDDATGLIERPFPRQEALRRRLNSAARAYKPNSWDVRRPTPKQSLDWLERTRNSVNRTIACLRSTADPEDDFEPARLIPLLDIQMQLEAGAEIITGARTFVEMATMRALRDLRTLNIWLEHAIPFVEESEKTADDRPAHRGDVALDKLIESCMKIWRDVLDRTIATQVGSETSAEPNEAGGALIRFLSIAVPIATEGEVAPTNEALRSRVERIRRRWKKSITDC